MNGTLTIGPLAIPVPLLVLLGGIVLGWWWGERLGRRRGVNMEWALYAVLAAGALASRLAFVWRYRSVYLDAPWSIADIRDGGWSVVAGLVGATVAAALLASWRKALGKPLLAALGSAGAVWLGANLALNALVPPQPALPALVLPSVSGQPMELVQFKGKPIVVNLWASWCPPCRREMPVLQRAQQQHPGAHFVFLNQGEQPDIVRRFLASNGLVLHNVLLDRHGEAGARLGHRALPATLFFDAQGRLLDTRVGELSAATLAERLAALGLPSSPHE